jgi:LPS-assembly protein
VQIKSHTILLKIPFNATGDVKVEDKIKNFIISAENITYLKNANTIISENNSKIVDNEGRTISANKISYNSIENTFNATGDVKVEDKIKNFIISAENITYLKNKNEMNSKGIISFLIDSRFDIKSEDIEILNSNQIIRSDKNTIIKDNKYKTLYELSKFSINIENEILKGENILVNTNFEMPFNDKFFFKNGIFDLKKQSFATQNIDLKFRKDLLGNKENDPRIKEFLLQEKMESPQLIKEYLLGAKIDENCTPWSIQAEKIEYDENKKQINYENALVKVYDVPIFYFPKFFTQDPQLKDNQGFYLRS